MGDLLTFPGVKQAEDRVVHVEYSQEDNVVILRAGDSEEKTVIPVPVVNDLFRITALLEEPIDGHMQLILQSLSRTDQPTEGDLSLLAAQMMEGDAGDDVASLSDRLIKVHAAQDPNSPQNVVQRLEVLIGTPDCPLLLKELIGSLLEYIRSRTQVNEEVAKTRNCMNATLTYGTTMLTHSGDHSVIGKVIVAFADVFDEIVGEAINTIYHYEDIRALFALPEVRWNRDAKLALPFPTGEKADPYIVEGILISCLLTGDVLDKEKTKMVLKRKMQEALPIQDSHIKHAIFTAQDLIECGFPESQITG